MRKRTSKIVSALRIVTLVVVFYHTTAAMAKDQEAFQSMLRTRGAGMRAVSWEFKTVHFSGPDLLHYVSAGEKNPIASAREAGIGAFTQQQYKAHGFAVLAGKRFRISRTQEFLSRAVSSGSFLETQEFTFDGRVYGSNLIRTGDAATKADVRPVVEYSSSAIGSSTLINLSVDAGAIFLLSNVPVIPGTDGLGYPYVTVPEFIEYLLQNSDSVQYEFGDNGLWSVRIPRDRDSANNSEFFTEYVFNSTQGGVLERISPLVGHGRLPSKDYIFTNVEYSNGVFGPQKVEWVDWANGRLLRTTLTSVVINPEFDDDTFLLEPTSDAVVVDHVRKTAYSVAGGDGEIAYSNFDYSAKDDLNVSVKDALSRHKLILLNLLVIMCATLFLLFRRWRTASK